MALCWGWVGGHGWETVVIAQGLGVFVPLLGVCGGVCSKVGGRECGVIWSATGGDGFREESSASFVSGSEP